MPATKQLAMHEESRQELPIYRGLDCRGTLLEVHKAATLQLQTASLDAGKAREKVSLLFLTINDLRAEIEKTHDKFYEIAVDFASERNITPSKPRTTGRQVGQENVPAESTSNYFKRAITIPFLDQLLGEIQSRFSGHLDVLDSLYAWYFRVIGPNIFLVFFRSIR